MIHTQNSDLVGCSTRLQYIIILQIYIRNAPNFLQSGTPLLKMAPLYEAVGCFWADYGTQYEQTGRDSSQSKREAPTPWDKFSCSIVD